MVIRVANAVFAVERMPPRQQLIHDDAEAVEVGASVDVAAEGLLGRQILERADDHAARAVLAVGRQLLGDAEVHELGDADAVDQNVVWFEVAVNNSMTVDLGEGKGDLHHQIRDLLDAGGLVQPLALLDGEQAVGRSILARGDDGLFAVEVAADLFSFDELHREVGAALVGAGFVDADDIGMLDALHGAELALEAQGRIRPRQGLRRNHLERHEGAALQVFDPVDDAHAAAAELADDVEVSNLFGLRGHRLSHDR